MEELTYMVCTRVQDLEEPVEGSTTTACVECGTDIWISAASRKVMSREKAMPVCVPCAARLSKEHEAAEIGMPSDEQFEEVIHALRAHPDYRPEWDGIFDDTATDSFEMLKGTASMTALAMTNPTDDWGSVVILEDYNGTTYPPLPIDTMRQVGLSEEVLARQLLPGLVHAASAERVLVGMSCWTLPDGKPIEGEMTDHPDRTEALVLISITADGVERASFAEITRHETSGPTLSEWKDIENPEETKGRFIDFLLPALQLVRKLREEG